MLCGVTRNVARAAGLKPAGTIGPFGALTLPARLHPPLTARTRGGMAGPFNQTVIAVVWDFDKTLIAGNMQTPLFARYGVDERAFWNEVDALRDFYLAHGAKRVADDSLYLNHILEYVGAGAFKGLSNAILHELGAELTFHPGMPEFL